MQQFGFMISRAPFVMDSFVKEQNEGGQVINIQVRYSPESPQQRGGEKARERRSKRRELARAGQEASSQETSIENDGNQEDMVESGTDDDCFLQDIGQIDNSDIRRQIYRPGIPKLSAFEAANTGQLLLPERHQRSVKFRPDTENYGHLFGLLKTRIFNLEEKMSNIESDRHKDQEQISRFQQQERIKSKKDQVKSKVFARTFCSCITAKLRKYLGMKTLFC